MSWSGAGGILTGALALIALQVTVTASANSSSGASTITSLLKYPGQLATRWLSPAEPLIPQVSSSKTAASSSSSSSGGQQATLDVATLGQPT